MVYVIENKKLKKIMAICRDMKFNVLNKFLPTSAGIGIMRCNRTLLFIQFNKYNVF